MSFARNANASDRARVRAAGLPEGNTPRVTRDPWSLSHPAPSLPSRPGAGRSGEFTQLLGEIHQLPRIAALSRSR